MWLDAGLFIGRKVLSRTLFFLPETRRLRSERYLRGVGETVKLRRADVVVASFGKSGRTWVRTLMSRFYQQRYGLPESSFLSFDNLHRKDRRIPRVFFTHDNYIKDYTGNAEDKRDFYGKKVVLLVRDPRDTAVSQYFQWKFRMGKSKKALNDYPPHGAEMTVPEFAMHPAGLAKVIGFLNGWRRELDKIGDVLVVRYEDLRADTAKELERVLRFAGEEPTPREIADCVAFASVDNMRKLETQNTFRWAGSRMRPADVNNPNSFKVRKAKVGGWRDHFTPEQAEAIEATIARDLEPGFGYRADEDGPDLPASPNRKAAVAATA